MPRKPINGMVAAAIDTLCALQAIPGLATNGFIENGYGGMSKGMAGGWKDMNIIRVAASYKVSPKLTLLCDQ